MLTSMGRQSRGTGLVVQRVFRGVPYGGELARWLGRNGLRFAGQRMEAQRSLCILQSLWAGGSLPFVFRHLSTGFVLAGRMFVFQLCCQEQVDSFLQRGMRLCLCALMEDRLGQAHVELQWHTVESECALVLQLRAWAGTHISFEAARG